MAIKIYSLENDGEKKLTTNFKIKEFRCKDGSDKILIDEKLPVLLQKIRDKFGAVSISSAYRNSSYNARVGGVKNSQHVNGRAADCTFAKGVKLLDVAKYAEKIGFTGIGLDDKYKMFIHLDTRPNKSFFRYNSSGGTYSVATFGSSSSTYKEPTATLKRGMKGDGVKWLQTRLTAKGYKLTIDGDFGLNTYNAVFSFQKANKLTADGIVGANTKAKLR